MGNILIRLYLQSFFFTASNVTEVCNGETWDADCGPNNRLIIRNADYGRIEVGHCVKVSLGHLGCSEPVTDILHKYCSNKRECRIKIPIKEMEDRMPCFGELIVHLKVTWTCLPVIGYCSPKKIPNSGILSKNFCKTTTLVAGRGQKMKINALVTQNSSRRECASHVTINHRRYCIPGSIGLHDLEIDDAEKMTIEFERKDVLVYSSRKKFCSHFIPKKINFVKPYSFKPIIFKYN